MADAERLHLFQGYGVELEYMIVDADSLAVRPLCAELLAAVAGEGASDFEDGDIAWSNELQLHVVELKTNGPVRALDVAPSFARSVRRLNALLAPLGARLMPTGMHPFMDPHRELRLWPHENDEVYRTFDRIFDCRGHGWANLQSAHLNFSFGEDATDDGEFARLHAAIRVVLPLLPALAASSPLVDGRVAGALDQRLRVYRDNARKVPEVTGRVVPEVATSRAAYQARILEPLYAAMAPHDPEGIVRHEWCNARGAIARFDRSAIEIRVLDVQECPSADLGIARLVDAVIRMLCAEEHVSLGALNAIETEALAAQLERCVEHGERAELTCAPWLTALGISGTTESGAVWRELRSRLLASSATSADRALDVVLDRGPLSRRILRALGPEPDHRAIVRVYRELADCLEADRPFIA